MIKNNSIELGTYVSPAIKVAQLKARRVMCQSPTFDEMQHSEIFNEDKEDVL